MKIVRIDYKKELETASKGMIMIHDPKLLIKLIVRMIVGKVQIRHAGMILYDRESDSYVLNISKGETGQNPGGVCRFERNHPIIALFTKKEYRSLIVNRNAIVTQDINKFIWQESLMTAGNGTKDLLFKVSDQMHMINAVACVPAYYRDKLLAVLLLGEKNDGTRFDQQELDFFAALASDAAMAIRNAQLFLDLKKEAEKNHDLLLRTTRVLASAIEAKDKYNHGNTERLANFPVLIALRTNEMGSDRFTEEFLKSLYLAGLLHNIGKIRVPEDSQQPKLTEAVEIMKRHTSTIEIPAASELKDSLTVKHHHERYDATVIPPHKGEETC